MERMSWLAALLLAAGAAPAPAQDNSTYQGGNLPGYNEPASRDQKVPSASDAEDHQEKVKTQRRRKAHRNHDKADTPSRAEPAKPGSGDIPEKNGKPGTTGVDEHGLDENRTPAPAPEQNPPKSDTQEQTDQGNYK